MDNHPKQKNMKKIGGILALSTLSVLGLQAQDKLDIKLSGRALFDGATYFQDEASENQDGKLIKGVAVRDIRMGFKATYGKWYLRADVSYTNNAISLKDTYLQYSFEKSNFVRLGHYTVPFGLSSAYSSAKKEYLDEPEANVFQPGRRIGIMHTLYNKPLWFQYGLFADNSALTKSTDKTGAQGYTLAGRFVWRPIMNDDYGFHVGFSGMHVKAESTTIGTHAAITYKKGYLTAVDKRTATNLNINDARWENKFTAEFQGIWRNIQLSSQFYWSHVSREQDRNYNTNGFYISARGIILKPANYKYNYHDSGVNNPDDGNLELVLGYGYLNLKDGDVLGTAAAAHITGNPGRMSDLTAGFSYFWNKYITLRLNYHHIRVSNFGLDTKTVNVLQARVQYLF